MRLMAMPKRLASSFREAMASRSRARLLADCGYYLLLSCMAVVMLLPLLWLVNGSLQPIWQINANPVVWIPQEWKSVPAGNTGRELLLLWAAIAEGRREEVIRIGARQYTTVVDAALVKGAQSVPKDELSSARPVDVDGVTLNVREWGGSQGRSPVIALARDPEQEGNLIVAEIASLAGALEVAPLDQVNQGKRGPAVVAGWELDARRMPDGRQLLVLGPESERAVVGSPGIAGRARLIQAERLGPKEHLDVGQTQLAIYPVEGEPEDYRAIVLVQENWQPAMAQSYVAENGFIARADQLSPEAESRLLNGLYMTVRRYAPPDGGSPFDVAILIHGSSEFLVMPVSKMAPLFAGPISLFVEPGSVSLGALTYRVQQDFEKDGRLVPAALVGDIQDLALIVSADAVRDAYDTVPSQLRRSTRIKPIITGYQRVVNLKLSGVPFWRFFANSAFVVLMNIVGHFLSCTLVAYGFARLRAPGRDLLFVILLGTMMVPGTILTLPTYLVFRDLGLLGGMVPLWIRSFCGNAFLIFVLRQFFMSIPYELDEAAILDGASRLQVLLRVILPLSKPALATVGIFTFWWHWNAFLDPLIYLDKQKHFTITVAMSAFKDRYARSAGYYDRILAGSVLSLLPMVGVFAFAQRYFIEGIQMQGLKG